MGGVSFSLRQASAADADMLSLVGAATFLEAFAGLVQGDAMLWHCRRNHSAEAYTRYLQQPQARAWLAELPAGFRSRTHDEQAPAPPGAPVGYALVTEPDFAADLLQPGDLELRRIYAFSRLHGSGLGQALYEAALAHVRACGARRMLLGVHRENARALRFYRRNGFQEVGTRTFTLGPAVYDDYVLALDLAR